MRRAVATLPRLCKPCRGTAEEKNERWKEVGDRRNYEIFRECTFKSLVMEKESDGESMTNQHMILQN